MCRGFESLLRYHLKIYPTRTDRGESQKDLNVRVGGQIDLCVGCHRTYGVAPVR